MENRFIEFIRYSAVIALTLLLYICNTHLLSKFGLDINPNVWYVVALAYSVVGIYSLLTITEWFPRIIFAILDSIAVFMELCPPSPDTYSRIVAVYYAFYTLYLFLVFGYVNWSKARPKANTATAEPVSETKTAPPQPAIAEAQPSKAIEQPRQMEIPFQGDSAPDEISIRTVSNTINGFFKGNQPIEVKKENARQYVEGLPPCKAREHGAQRLLVQFGIKVSETTLS